MELVPIQSDSGCPSPDAVQAEVRELTTPEQRQGVPADANVMVSDRGESIAIAITRDGKTTVRIYQDAARDCARRSHFVSVLVVVSLMPPDLGSDPEPEPPPDPTRPPPPTAPEPRPEPEPEPEEPSALPTRHVHIELGARLDVSTPISDTARIVSPGGTLGVAIGSGDLRLTLATGYSPATEIRYTGASAGEATLERLEVALGARWVVTRAPLTTAFDLGAVGMRAQLTGESSRRPAQDTAFNAGARLGLHLALADHQLLSPFVDFCGALYPLAPALSELPQGTVGHLPYVWLGVSGGLALAL